MGGWTPATSLRACMRARVRVCVRARVRVCVRARVRAYVHARVRVNKFVIGLVKRNGSLI